MASKLLLKKSDVNRTSRGSNFDSAKTIGLVYLDESIEKYTEIKNYVHYLESEHGLRNISVLGYVPLDKKAYPEYLKTNVLYDFFTKSDLSWTLKPNKSVDGFVHKEFDILIDCSHKLCFPISYIMQDSKARMKVCRIDAFHVKRCDLLVDMPTEKSTEIYLKEINRMLSQLKIK